MSSWAISGGAGYVGSNLAEALLAEGASVRLLARRSLPERERQVVITGDIRDAAAADALVTGASVVVHCAAWVHRLPASPADVEECRAVNVEGTRVLLEAAKRRGAHAFIFISSSNVYGSDTERAATESDPCRPDSLYGQTKLEAEALVLASSSPEFSAIVLRPSVVIGRGAPGNFGKLASLVNRGVFPLVNGGRAKKSMLPIERLIAVIVAIGNDHARVAGEIFNVTGESLTIRRIATLVAASSGARVRFIPIPSWLFRGAARVLAFVRLRRVARMFDTFVHDALLDGSKLARYGFQDGPTTEEAVERIWRS